MDRQTVFTAMKAYRAAYRVHSALVKYHDGLVGQQTALMPMIQQAEAEMNKAREAMLRAVQANDATKA